MTSEEVREAVHDALFGGGTSIGMWNNDWSFFCRTCLHMETATDKAEAEAKAAAHRCPTGCPDCDKPPSWLAGWGLGQ